MTNLSRSLFGLLLLCAAFVPAYSQTPAPCSDPAYRLAGNNRIEKEYGGCVLHERYATPGRYTGESLNSYDPAKKVWHQTWVDNSGTLLLLDGKFNGKSMVLEGSTMASSGQETKHRISWTPNADGSVRQLWESTDAKGAWTVAFDGLYKRASNP
jgi:hypothetical protein